MYDDKGPITALETLGNGLGNLIVSPIIFVINYIISIVILPFAFLRDLFDFSTP